MRNNLIGILWMLLHCLSTACVSALSKNLASHYNIFQIIFIQNIISVSILFFYLICSRNNSININKPYLNITRAITHFIGLASYYYALKFVPLIEVRAISLTSPIIKTILAMIILKETIYSNRAIGLIIGAIGAFIAIFNPVKYSFNPHILYVIFAILIWSFSSILIKLINKHDSDISQLFFFLLISSIISTPNAVISWKNIVSADFSTFLFLGIFYFINVSFTLKAYKYADITILMPFNFSTVIFASLIAHFYFHEIIHDRIIIGSLIVIISTIYITYKEKYNKIANIS